MFIIYISIAANNDLKMIGNFNRTLEDFQFVKFPEYKSDAEYTRNHYDSMGVHTSTPDFYPQEDWDNNTDNNFDDLNSRYINNTSMSEPPRALSSTQCNIYEDDEDDEEEEDEAIFIGTTNGPAAKFQIRVDRVKKHATKKLMGSEIADDKKKYRDILTGLNDTKSDASSILKDMSTFYDNQTAEAKTEGTSSSSVDCQTSQKSFDSFKVFEALC